MLQAGKFPAGAVELGEGELAQVVFPTARVPAAAAAVPGPEGNLAELMRAIAFPNANIIFNLQVKDPAAARAKPLATSPFDYVEWGSTVYPGWLAVDQAAVALTETASLLLTPGRRCQNGRAAPVDRADWKQYVAALVDAGKLARQASRARTARRVRRGQREAERRVRELSQGVPRQGRRRGQRSRPVPVVQAFRPAVFAQEVSSCAGF